MKKPSVLSDQHGVAMVFEVILVALVLAVVGWAIYTSSHHTTAVTSDSIPTSQKVSLVRYVKPESGLQLRTSDSDSATSAATLGFASVVHIDRDVDATWYHGTSGGQSGFLHKQDVAQTSAELTADWKTYTSKTEKASFKYPKDWTVTSPAVVSVDPAADGVGVKSPSGAITISWNSFISGIGGTCGGDCPLMTVLGLEGIPGANGLSVVSGTERVDAKSYRPWLAVQDGQGITKTTTTMPYLIYQGRHNGASLGYSENSFVQFSTSGFVSDGPTMSQAQALAYFNQPETYVAKQIMLSLSY